MEELEAKIHELIRLNKAQSDKIVELNHEIQMLKLDTNLAKELVIRKLNSKYVALSKIKQANTDMEIAKYTFENIHIALDVIERYVS